MPPREKQLKARFPFVEIPGSTLELNVSGRESAGVDPALNSPNLQWNQRLLKWLESSYHLWNRAEIGEQACG